MSVFLKNLVEKAIIEAARLLKRDSQEIPFIIGEQRKELFIERSFNKAYQTIHRYLTNSNSSYGFILKDKIIKETENDSYWLIDPIDVVENFSNGLPFWGTTVALGKKTGSGYVFECVFFYMPIFDEMFVVKANEGAFLNKSKLNLKEKKHYFLTAGPNLKRNLGSNLAHIFYCACSKFSLVVLKNDNNYEEAVAKLLMNEICGELKQEKDRIIIGSSYALKVFLN